MGSPLTYEEMASNLEKAAATHTDLVKRARGLALAQIMRAAAKMPFMQKPGEPNTHTSERLNVRELN